MIHLTLTRETTWSGHDLLKEEYLSRRAYAEEGGLIANFASCLSAGGDFHEPIILRLSRVSKSCDRRCDLQVKGDTSGTLRYNNYVHTCEEIICTQKVFLKINKTPDEDLGLGPDIRIRSEQA